MRAQELLKLLKKNGCYLHRNGKRHDIWYSRKTHKQFSVPRHKADIPSGILKDAGLKLGH